MSIKVEKQDTILDEEELQEKTTDEELEEEEESTVKLSTMTQRGIYTAYKYTFNVEPIYLQEVDEYLHDNVYVPRKTDINGNVITDKELSTFMSQCFLKDTAKATETEEEVEEKKESAVDKVKSLFRKKSKVDYSEFPMAKGIVKWVERKVSYNGKKICFEDLEQKYKLSKVEIAKLIMYLSEFSGF